MQHVAGITNLLLNIEHTVAKRRLLYPLMLNALLWALIMYVALWVPSW